MELGVGNPYVSSGGWKYEGKRKFWEKVKNSLNIAVGAERRVEKSESGGTHGAPCLKSKNSKNVTSWKAKQLLGSLCSGKSSFITRVTSVIFRNVCFYYSGATWTLPALASCSSGVAQDRAHKITTSVCYSPGLLSKTPNSILTPFSFP